MYKEAWCTCKIVVLLIKPIDFVEFPLPLPSSDLKVPISQPCLLGGQSGQGLLRYTNTKKAWQNQNNSHVKKISSKFSNKVAFSFIKIIRACAINNFNGNVNMSRRLQTTAENFENSPNSRRLTVSCHVILLVTWLPSCKIHGEVVERQTEVSISFPVKLFSIQWIQKPKPSSTRKEMLCECQCV